MFKSDDGLAVIERAWRSGLKPDPLLTVSAWADPHRVLSQRLLRARMVADGEASPAFCQKARDEVVPATDPSVLDRNAKEAGRSGR